MRDPFSNECIVDCFDLDRGNAGLSGEIIFFDDAFTDQIKGSPRIKNDLLFNREKCSISYPLCILGFVWASNTAVACFTAVKKQLELTTSHSFFVR